MSVLLYEKRDSYAILTMNRPERLNAGGLQMREEMVTALADFDADPAMRAGIVTGNGRSVQRRHGPEGGRRAGRAR